MRTPPSATAFVTLMLLLAASASTPFAAADFSLGLSPSDTIPPFDPPGTSTEDVLEFVDENTGDRVCVEDSVDRPALGHPVYAAASGGNSYVVYRDDTINLGAVYVSFSLAPVGTMDHYVFAIKIDGPLGEEGRAWYGTHGSCRYVTNVGAGGSFSIESLAGTWGLETEESCTTSHWWDANVGLKVTFAPKPSGGASGTIRWGESFTCTSTSVYSDATLMVDSGSSNDLCIIANDLCSPPLSIDLDEHHEAAISVPALTSVHYDRDTLLYGENSVTIAGRIEMGRLPNGRPAELVIASRGPIIVTGVIETSAGLPAEPTTGTGVLVGRPGGSGGSVVLATDATTGVVELAPGSAIILGSGAAGGSATAMGPAALVLGGDGGDAGALMVHAATLRARGSIHPGIGGAGGDAEGEAGLPLAIGARGGDAGAASIAVSRVAQLEGDALGMPAPFRLSFPMPPAADAVALSPDATLRGFFANLREARIADVVAEQSSVSLGAGVAGHVLTILNTVAPCNGANGGNAAMRGESGAKGADQPPRASLSLVEGDPGMDGNGGTTGGVGPNAVGGAGGSAQQGCRAGNGGRGTSTGGTGGVGGTGGKGGYGIVRGGIGGTGGPGGVGGLGGHGEGGQGGGGFCATPGNGGTGVSNGGTGGRGGRGGEGGDSLAEGGPGGPGHSGGAQGGGPGAAVAGEGGVTLCGHEIWRFGSAGGTSESSGGSGGAGGSGPSGDTNVIPDPGLGEVFGFSGWKQFCLGNPICDDHAVLQQLRDQSPD